MNPSLTRERGRAIEAVIARTRGQGVEEQTRAVAEICAADPDLRRDVESLLTWADAASPDHATRTVQLAVGTPIGRYTVLAQLGRGGMGEVYLARDTRLLRDVALKRLTVRGGASRQSPERLLREAQVLGQLDHRNIAAVYDVIQDGDDTYTVMEYAPGDTLAAIVRRELPSFALVLDIARQITDALTHAHRRNVVHRDLKPANVILRSDGVVKVLDFGIARLVSDAAAETRPSDRSQTAPAAIVGTPAYMAPEQFFGDEVDQRADIYSLGVVLFELLTGHRPYQLEDVVELALAKLTLPAPPLHAVRADVPTDLAAVVDRALQAELGARFQSAEELSAALSAVSVNGPRTRSRALKGVAAGVLAAGVIAGAAAATGYRVPWLTTLLTSRAGTASPAPTRVLAVVPFTPLAPVDSLAQSVASGVPSLIAAHLSALPGISTVPYSETLLSYRDGAVPATEVANELGAHYVITGQVQRAARSIVVTVSLIDTDSSQVAWSDHYEGDAEDAAGLQRRVPGHVAEALVARQLVPRASIATTRPPTADPAALADYGQGRRYLERRDVPANLDYALQLFQAATAKDPNFALAHAGIGETLWAKYGATKDADYVLQAREALTEALRLDPGAIEVRYALAVLYDGTGRSDAAVEELRRVVDAQPSFDSAHRRLGRILLEQGQVRAGLAELRLAVDLRPDFATNHMALGSGYYAAGEYRNSVAAFTRAAELQPDDARSYQMRGTAEHMLGHLDEALQNYERANQLRPTATAFSNIGTIHFAQGRFTAAVQAYKQALALDANSPSTYVNLGDAYRRIGQGPPATAAYVSAVRRCEAELKVRPNDGMLLSILAMAEAKLGQANRAVEHADAAARARPTDNQILYNLAVAYDQAGHTERAVPLLEEALQRGYSKELVRIDGDLVRLRAQPAIQQLLEN